MDYTKILLNSFLNIKSNDAHANSLIDMCLINSSNNNDRPLNIGVYFNILDICMY